MVLRRDLLGEEVYAKGMMSISGTHQGVRVARWILNFLRDGGA